jgi:hypothetical protein
MNLLEDAAGDVQPEQAPEMFGVAALGVAGPPPRGRAWQLVRRAASQADTQGWIAGPSPASMTIAFDWYPAPRV